MFKIIVKGLTPPYIFSMLRSLYLRFNMGEPIYEGFYRNPVDVPLITGNPFVHPNWLSYVDVRAESRKNGVANQDMHEMCLTLIGSTLPASDELGLQSIVDFGGGFTQRQSARGFDARARLYADSRLLQRCGSGQVLEVRKNAGFRRVFTDHRARYGLSAQSGQ